MMLRGSLLTAVIAIGSQSLHAQQVVPLKRYSTDGHPKGLGVSLQIEYPQNWEAKENAEPTAVQSLVSPSGRESCIIVLRATPSARRAEGAVIETLMSDQMLRAMVPAGSLFRKAQRTQFNNAPGAAVRYGALDKNGLAGGRAELETYILPLGKRFLFLTCGVTTEAGVTEEEVIERFKQLEPLFQKMANSVRVENRASEISKGKNTDAEIRSLVAGDWRHRRAEGDRELKATGRYSIDGTFSGDLTIKRQDETITVFVTGIWTVIDGVLIQIIETSKPPMLKRGHESRDEVLSIDDEELKLKTESGDQMTWVRLTDRSLPLEAGWVLHQKTSEGFAIDLPADWNEVPVEQIIAKTSSPSYEAAIEKDPTIAAYMKDPANRQALAFAKFAAIDSSSIPASSAFANTCEVHKIPAGKADSLDNFLQEYLVGANVKAYIIKPISQRSIVLPIGKAYEVRFGVKMSVTSGAPLTLALTQYFVIAEDHLYIIRFFTQSNYAERYAPIVERSAQSLRLVGN